MPVKLIAQNFNIYEGDNLHPGARTGEISIDHLISAGAAGVIIGHSETNDSPEVINSKIKTVINNKNLPPDFKLIILVGESWQEFKEKSEPEVAAIIYGKCETVFKDIPKEIVANSIIGYESKWGTQGSGQSNVVPPQPKLISTCVASIRQFVSDKYQDAKPFFIYGGTATPARTLEILTDKNLDGLILGSACNTLQKTMAIVQAILEVKGNEDKVLICNFKAYILSDSYQDYIAELKKLPANFFVYVAPPHTDLRLVKQLT
ncbi:MAG: triose-phosphate isomerase [Patescibacteria group bacterium]